MWLQKLLQEFEDSLAVLQAEGRMRILKPHAAAGARADFELLRERSSISLPFAMLYALSLFDEGERQRAIP